MKKKLPKILFKLSSWMRSNPVFATAILTMVFLLVYILFIKDNSYFGLAVLGAFIVGIYLLCVLFNIFSCKDSHLASIIRFYWKNKKDFLFMMVSDVLFFVALTIFGIVMNFLFPAEEIGRYSVPVALAFVIIFFTLFTILYSCFKFFILNILKRLTKETEFRLFELQSFFWLNVFNFVVCIVLLILINMILLPLVGNVSLAARPELSGGAMFFVILLLLLFIVTVYGLFNVSHALYIKGYDLRHLIPRLINRLVWSGHSYYRILMENGVVFFAFLVLFYIIGSIVRLFVTDTNLTLVEGVYAQVFSVLFIGLLLLLHSINRLYYIILTDKKEWKPQG